MGDMFQRCINSSLVTQLSNVQLCVKQK